MGYIQPPAGRERVPGPDVFDSVREVQLLVVSIKTYQDEIDSTMRSRNSLESQMWRELSGPVPLENTARRSHGGGVLADKISGMHERKFDV